MSQNEQTPEDFASGNYLQGKNYKKGQKLAAKVVSYEGYKSIKDKSTGENREAPVYKVEVNGDEYMLRMNKTNTGILVSTYDLTEWSALTGKTLTLQQTETTMGAGFTVTDCK